MNRRGIVFLIIIFSPAAMAAQAATPPDMPTRVAPPPATKLEAFEPKAGTIVLFGYEELGRVGTVSLDVRELRSGGGVAIRGVVVDVRQSEYRRERAFIDADEIPELVKGIDALLEVSANPTKFEMFEVQYKTKGELQLVAFNSSSGKLSYSIRAGRLTQASAFSLGPADLTKLKEMLLRAQAKLAGLASAGGL